MPLNTSVKWFHGAMSVGTGCPGARGAVAGDMIAILDACLVNGFGDVTASTVEVAGNVCTMTFPGGHSFEAHTVARVAGATPAGLNSDWKVDTVNATQITFTTAGIADQTATGTITAKLAPAGWSKAFSGTNLAAYRAPTGNRLYLRVDDTGTSTARVSGYEVMTDVNTGTNQFLNVAGGGYAFKRSSGTTTTWSLFADERSFYFNLQYTSADWRTWSFGEIASVKAGDAFNTVIQASTTSNPTAATYDITLGIDGGTGNNLARTAARSQSQSVGSVGLNTTFAFLRGNSSGVISGGVTQAYSAPYPNPADNGLYLSKITATENSGASYRGYLPGVYACPQLLPSAVWTNRQLLTGAGLFANKYLCYVAEAANNGGTTMPGIFFDVTGPWR